jgi:hypothetical protein
MPLFPSETNKQKRVLALAAPLMCMRKGNGIVKSSGMKIGNRDSCLHSSSKPFKVRYSSSQLIAIPMLHSLWMCTRYLLFTSCSFFRYAAKTPLVKSLPSAEEEEEEGRWEALLSPQLLVAMLLGRRNSFLQ